PISSFLFLPSAPSQIYTLSLHDALPICGFNGGAQHPASAAGVHREHADFQACSLANGGSDGIGNVVVLEIEKDLASRVHQVAHEDRKSTRLNSSHVAISYAVFCLKKKKR